MTTEPAAEHPTFERSGEWVVPEVSYVEPHRRFCALCGRPIARRYWRTKLAGVPLVFCDPSHAALYVEYRGVIDGPEMGNASTSGGQGHD